MNDMLKLFSTEVKFIHDNERSFANNFCRGEIIDLLDVYFSEQTMCVCYERDFGKHIVRIEDVREYYKWKRQVRKE